MRELPTVWASDSLNRYGTRFSPGSLYRALVDTRETGIPQLVSHDMGRLVGWTIPTSVSLRPGLTRLHGVTLLPETETEHAELRDVLHGHMSRQLSVKVRPFLPELRKQLDGFLDGSERLLLCGAAALVAPNLARRVAQELFAHEDKDGLLPLAQLQQFQSGLFRHGTLVLFAHPSLRRGFSRWNGLNVPLIQALTELRSQIGVNVRIRLDPNAVGLASTAYTPGELAYWFGPKFSDDLASIPAGVTRHEADDLQQFYYGISRTELWWQSRKGSHIFEAEELRDIPTPSGKEGTYSCRYVHSIVEEDSGRIVHADGAVREYSEADMIARLGCSIDMAGRHSRYTKCWRVDGAVPLATWKLLVHHHFRDNPLIGEYLEPRLVKQPSQPVGATAEVRALLSRRRVADLLPPRLEAGKSVRLLLSLHSPHDDQLALPRTVQAAHDLLVDGERQPVVDLDTFELRKLLLGAGEDLGIPRNALVVAHEDRWHILPPIVHDSPAAAGATLDALERLISSWAANEEDQVAAFSLGAIFDNRELRIAAVGLAVDLGPQIDRLRTLFRVKDDEQVADWIDAAAPTLASSDQVVSSHSREDGIEWLMGSLATFAPTRSVIDPQFIEITASAGQREFVLHIADEDSELKEALQECKVYPALAWQIRAALCKACSQDYLECLCSEYLMPSAGPRWTDARVLYAFWTDKPALPTAPHSAQAPGG